MFTINVSQCKSRDQKYFSKTCCRCSWPGHSAEVRDRAAVEQGDGAVRLGGQRHLQTSPEEAQDHAGLRLTISFLERHEELE